MEFEFRKYDGSTTAINPRVERRGEQLTMKLNEQNCDYFLVLSRTPGGCVDLQDESIQKALVEKKNLFPGAQSEPLMANVTFSYIEWSDYRVNDYAIDLSNRIAEYTIVGCRQERDCLIIFIPDGNMSCTARVSLTISYRVTRVETKASRRLFKKDVPQQSFFAVEFDKVADYQDGGIIYNLDGLEWNYPITRKMLENGKFYIDSGRGMPRFSTTILGLELKQL